MALPIVDWKELGFGLERIGMTVGEIGEKMRGNFEAARVGLGDDGREEAIERIEAIEEAYNGILEEIEASGVSEKKKLEITMHISMLMNGNGGGDGNGGGLEAGQYFIRREVGEFGETGNAGNIQFGDRFDDGGGDGDRVQQKFMYRLDDGVIVRVEVSVNYGEDTYRYIAEYFGESMADEVRQLQIDWNEVAKKVGKGALDFGEGIVMVPVDDSI